MRQLAVFRNGIFAGVLSEENRQSFTFQYDDAYLLSDNSQAISLTLPLSKQVYRSGFLFPFFYNMLSEGVNRKLQSLLFKIDENDSFALLAKTAEHDTVGAVTLKPLN